MFRSLVVATFALVASALLAATVGANELQRWQGAHSSVSTPMTIVATNADDWSRIWQLVGQKPDKEFDPSRHAAVAIFLGQRNTGGYGVSIVSMGPRQGRFVIVVDETTPGGGMVTQALTTPWLVLLLDRPTETIDIEPKFRINGTLWRLPPGNSRSLAEIVH